MISYIHAASEVHATLHDGLHAKVHQRSETRWTIANVCAAVYDRTPSPALGSVWRGGLAVEQLLHVRHGCAVNPARHLPHGREVASALVADVVEAPAVASGFGQACVGVRWRGGVRVSQREGKDHRVI